MSGMIGCYVLDGFLILYGIILTVLYFRLKITSDKKSPTRHLEKQPAEGGIYAGLTSPSADTYDTVRTNKKLMVA
ncbi:High affinity immunoglobulin epsilon receptor subunit gamma [Oryzias melastigma]|uniref:high affinity immunoglobulin epsilon receptor subunit gamma n=1 Tax=Oryzias melastigma TaxID=30732 RepID=UPI000CF7FCC2|nr:high affinity immunoglobulin epsilon receptor subunit gamma [Oryzias melastigma]KAF6714642.1 High affinity immunoglobulin epsilon receptor subunit gamma [Oryzias melastigma]